MLDTNKSILINIKNNMLNINLEVITDEVINNITKNKIDKLNLLNKFL